MNIDDLRKDFYEAQARKYEKSGFRMSDKAIFDWFAIEIKIIKDAYEHLHQTNAANFKELCEIKFQQKQSIEISDKEIEAKVAIDFKTDIKGTVYANGRYFSNGAKWMRDKQGIAPNKEVEIQFIIDGAYLSKPYSIINLLDVDESKVLEDTEVCDCRLTESNNHCEGDCLKYENSKITGFKFKI